MLALFDIESRTKRGSSLYDYWMDRMQRALDTIASEANKGKATNKPQVQTAIRLDKSR
jgi:hypothetical protein